MRLRLPKTALTVVLIGAAASALGQTSSPFETYRRYRDEPVGDWRKANEQVGQIGGWRAYAREAAGSPSPAAASPGTRATAAPSTPASAASAPAPGHGGHKQ